jgi:site-specific DNA-methyltransferase (adenine-specific)/modification methylase
MKVEIGDATLYLGDCMDILPTLDKVDAVITDPPYGIGADKGKKGAIPFKGGKTYEMAWHPENNWDNQRPDKQIFDLMIEKSKFAIIWGGNYFADWLTAQGKWLWWDKCQTMPSYGDGELAWTNLSGTTPKKFTWANNKIFADRTERHHPTQKPLELMKWCIEQVGQPVTVLDPFMGSGTTGVAAIQMGRKFIGIEREPKYFDIACKRIEQASKQVDMFIEKPKQEQEAMF